MFNNNIININRYENEANEAENKIIIKETPNTTLDFDSFQHEYRFLVDAILIYVDVIVEKVLKHENTSADPRVTVSIFYASLLIAHFLHSHFA